MNIHENKKWIIPKYVNWIMNKNKSIWIVSIAVLTYTNKASLAFGVAEDFIHCALL